MNEVIDLRFLLTIRESDSLLAASRKLGLTHSAVTQRLQQMERRLSIRLLDRSSRQLRFTDEGELLCLRGAGLVEQFDALLEDLQERRRGFVGKLKVNAPFGFGRHHVAPAAAEFQRLHPEIEIALSLSEQPMVEVNDRFDVVVHIGQLRSSNMVAHIIAPNRRYVCASPDFIERYGSPEHPEDLISLPCIALRENNEDVTRWSFSRTGNTLNVRIRPALSCNDGSTIRKWACDGYGIIMRSEWDVAESLANGSLVRLLPGWELPDADIVALTHQREGLPARTTNFLRFLQARFRPHPSWREK